MFIKHRASDEILAVRPSKPAFAFLTFKLRSPNGPVDEEGLPDDFPLVEIAPVTGIGTVERIVAHDKIMIGPYPEFATRRQVAQQRVPDIVIFVEPKRFDRSAGRV